MLTVHSLCQTPEVSLRPFLFSQTDSFLHIQAFADRIRRYSQLAFFKFNSLIQIPPAADNAAILSTSTPRGERDSPAFAEKKMGT